MSRWIVIGRVMRIHYRMVMNSGYLCDGFRMYWRGAVDFCQPTEFDAWDQLEAAIRVRLEFAGLSPVDVVVDVSGHHRAVRVLVTRAGHKLRRRAYGLDRFADHKAAHGSSW